MQSKTSALGGARATLAAIYERLLVVVPEDLWVRVRSPIGDRPNQSVIAVGE